MSAIQVNKDNFQEVVLNSDKPVLVDFWASWCGPCRMVAPVLEEIANERSDVKVCKINVDEEPELAGRYNVMSIPTLLLNIPINIIVHDLTGIMAINSTLPVAGGVGLVIISVALTFIAGLIPSGLAAKKDPVEALRTE